ncbi:ATP-dependent DNA helicase [Trichonephila clavipes]|nr:ATP-dependent DNA helicase [Trichonephila clavipes]
MLTFRVQGQIYYHAGSLLPLPDADHKLLQIYFMANSDEQIEQRCHYNAGTRREIVGALQGLFDQHNELVRLFKTAIQRMPADDYAVVIRADKRPVGQHERQFNAPTIDEVAIVIVGEEFESRDIILHRRSGDIQRVSETHRSYDGLQYPILFWRGDDGYHFNIKMINPQTGEGTNKKVSAMNYYSYRLMIRQNAENHILKCRQLFHQYIVDMYAKIETERLLYIRLNQTELRSEQYIHLRDAIVNDGNVNPNELGRMAILPSTFTGSLRHMHEYAQDAMTYVRAYGRPDLLQYADNVRARALVPPATTLTAFYSLCQDDLFAKTLLYSEVPKFYTWNASTKRFQRRSLAVEGHTNLYSSYALGRLYTVHPNNTECFYLRLLLINIHGPISFQDLRTVNGQLCATYRQACQELNLLENDAHWDTALADASNTARPKQIRTLFAIILTTCFPSNPKDLWEKYKDYMSEDILHHLRATNQNPDIQFTPNVYNEALILIEDICLTIANKALGQLGMPASNRPENNLFDRDLQRETHYDSDELGTFIKTNLPQLILEQSNAYDRIMRAITEQSGGLFFIDAPGGTGKTFLLSLILATIRSQNNIALAIASSGIAATLLDGGRTTHSAWKLLLNLKNTEAPTCNISKNSGMGKVLQTCQIIIWDECTMSHKKALEALDRTLRDFRGNRRIFGGALILLSGDFRQTLPIIPGSTPADELHACLKSSVLWRHLQKLTLKTNMRVQLQRDASVGNFAKQLMDIGNGRMEIDESTQCITLPANFCKITESIDELQPKNIDVNTINFTIQHGIPSETTTYKSIDTVENQDEVVNYPTEFLNSLDLPGMPPHVLTLKFGVPIILLRSINPPRLCNGTRLSVKKMMNNAIEATILTGKF